MGGSNQELGGMYFSRVQAPSPQKNWREISLPDFFLGEAAVVHRPGCIGLVSLRAQ